MKKVIIIGNSGSGKSWLGKKLAEMLAMPHIEMDRIFWESGGYNRKRKDSEVDAHLMEIQAYDSWIVEGVFGHLVDQLVSFGDALIYLHVPWEECRENLLNRGWESSRQMDSQTAKDNFDALLDWASKYDTRNSKASLTYHRFLFDGFAGEKHCVCSRREINRLFEFLSLYRCG